jgi:hypothetical protein
VNHDHDPDDFALWLFWAPQTASGWGGLFLFAVWIAVGVWWFA